MPRVRFSREGLEIEVAAGTLIREAGVAAGAQLHSGIFQIDNCHGHGRCGECRVFVLSGAPRLSGETEREQRAGRPRGRRQQVRRGNDPALDERLACQTRVWGDVSVWTRAREGDPLGRDR